MSRSSFADMVSITLSRRRRVDVSAMATDGVYKEIIEGNARTNINMPKEFMLLIL
jgi:hypothetical protein